MFEISAEIPPYCYGVDTDSIVCRNSDDPEGIFQRWLRRLDLVEYLDLDLDLVLSNVGLELVLGRAQWA